MGDVLQPLEMLGPEVQGETLENVSSTPYLGVCLSKTLEWEAHINKITSKVNSILGFFRRRWPPISPWSDHP